MCKHVWAFYTVLLVILNMPVWADQYIPTSLQCPSGYAKWDSSATAINNDGKIVGRLYVDSSGLAHGLYWGAPTSDPVDLTISNNFAYLAGINNYGEIVGTLHGINEREATAAKMMLYSTPIPLNDLPETLGSWAYAINDNNQVVGSAIGLANGVAENWAVMWDADGNPHKITASSTGYCAAWAINDSGIVVGGNTLSDTTGHKAFAWDLNGGYRELTSLNETDWSEAYGINASGQVVGISGDHAVIWQPDGSIRDLSGMGNLGKAYGVNMLGDIAGTLNGHAVIWNHSGSIINLDTDINGVIGSTAYAINDSNIIVGELLYEDGSSRAVVWQSVPEPSTCFALICGLVGIIAQAKRRQNL